MFDYDEDVQEINPIILVDDVPKTGMPEADMMSFTLAKSKGQVGTTFMNDKREVLIGKETGKTTNTKVTPMDVVDDAFHGASFEEEDMPFVVSGHVVVNEATKNVFLLKKVPDTRISRTDMQANHREYINSAYMFVGILDKGGYLFKKIGGSK